MKKMKLNILTFLLITLSPHLFAQGTPTDCGEYKGVSIPCWRDYLRNNEGDESLPYFPYAKRANGCSVLNYKPGKADIFHADGEIYNFKMSCDWHDTCYYSLDSDREICNENFINLLARECNHGTSEASALCMKRANTFYQAAKSASLVVHTYSQTLEKLYLKRAYEYVQKVKEDEK
jgi:hypothetical protein